MRSACVLLPASECVWASVTERPSAWSTLTIAQVEGKLHLELGKLHLSSSVGWRERWDGERVGVRVAGGRFKARNPKPCSPLWGFCFSSETLTTQNMQHVVAELPSHTDVSPDSYRIKGTRNSGAKR